MNLDQIQQRVAALMEGIEHPRMAAGLALGEECGEVLKCILETEAYGADDDGALAGEIGDVLLSLAEICDRFGLSLSECAAGAIEKLERKAPEWREQLGPRLRDLRERADG